MTQTEAQSAKAENAPSRIAAKIRLRSSEFRKKREEGWQELETLVTKSEKRGIKSLTANELQRLPMLYRAALSSLSVARSIALDRNLLGYLENLTMRAFIVVYGPRTGLFASIGHFFRRGFPSAVRAGSKHFLIAFIILLAGTAAGFLLVELDKTWYYAIIPFGLAEGRGPDATPEYLLSVLYAHWDGFEEAFGRFANYLFQHNTWVGLLTFALGFALGIPTILLTVYQGLILGAFLAAHYNQGLLIDVLGWISIHGITEFTAIILCCVAGLMLADKILFPGRYSRMDSLGSQGIQAAQVAMGAMFMLVIAAILEGGFREMTASFGFEKTNVTILRFSIAGGTALLWLIYFRYAGREDTRQ